MSHWVGSSVTSRLLTGSGQANERASNSLAPWVDPFLGAVAESYSLTGRGPFVIARREFAATLIDMEQKKSPRKSKKVVKTSTTPAEVAARMAALPKPKNPKPFGRPTKYNAGMPQAMVDYFLCALEDIEEVERNLSKVGHLQWVQKPGEIPTLGNFAIEIGVNSDTLHEWASVNPLFSDAVKTAKEIGARIALRLGASGGCPPAISVFSLKNLAGWTDKATIEVEGPVALTFDSQDEDA